MKQQTTSATASTSDRLSRRTWVVLLVVASVTIAGVRLFRKPASATAPVSSGTWESELPGPVRDDGRSAAVVPTPAEDRQRLSQVTATIIKTLTGNSKVDLSGFSAGDLIANLKDESLPLAARRQVAMELARRSQPAAFTALKELAVSGVANLRAVAAEALGHSVQAEAKTVLLALLGEKDEVVVQGVIRGLSAVGDGDAIKALSSLLTDAVDSRSLRAAAALGLGEMKSADGAVALITALNQLDDVTLREQVLTALSRQPLELTQPFFQAYLDAPDVKPSLRVAALEAVAGTQGDAAPLLLRYTRDTDPQVRAAAVWGLTMVETPSGTATELTMLLAGERDAEVRTRLYQALVSQDEFDFAGVLPAIEREQDTAARLAGFNLWAGQCREEGQGATALRFDQIAVPELQGVALGASDLNEQLTAVIALRRAGTVAAQGSLQQIAAQAKNVEVAKAAQSALAARSQATLQTKQPTTK